jgi:hypothetical protein
MSTTITTYYEGASYDSIRASDGNAGVDAQLTETTAPGGDTVEISSPAGGAAPVTYEPPDVADRFRFDIQNGMFDKRLRYTPLRTRYEGGASATYDARGSMRGQMGGSAGVYAAMFALQYDDAQPNPSQAGSNVEARSELNRITDQKLSLLGSL